MVVVNLWFNNLSNLQNACQSADWHAFCGSSVCVTQSADCANSQIACNIYMYMYMYKYTCTCTQYTCIYMYCIVKDINTCTCRNNNFLYIIIITFISLDLVKFDLKTLRQYLTDMDHIGTCVTHILLIYTHINIT